MLLMPDTPDAETPTNTTVELLKGLGGWISQYGISTVILLAFGWWFVTSWSGPLVDAHLEYLTRQTAAAEKQAAEIAELRTTIERLDDRLAADE